MMGFLGNRRLRVVRGFTLMEMVVVLGIFSVVVTSASDIFIMANKSQRKVIALEKAQADARFAMEAMAREIRTGTIDFAYYESRYTLEELASPESFEELAIIDSENERIVFGKSDNEQYCGTGGAPCLTVRIGGSDPQPISPKDVVVRNARFYLMPKRDPAYFNPSTGLYAADVQPHVTIVLALESARQDPAARSVVYFQTTVVNRGYGR